MYTLSTPTIQASVERAFDAYEYNQPSENIIMDLFMKKGGIEVIEGIATYGGGDRLIAVAQRVVLRNYTLEAWKLRMVARDVHVYSDLEVLEALKNHPNASLEIQQKASLDIQQKLAKQLAA